MNSGPRLRPPHPTTRLRATPPTTGGAPEEYEAAKQGDPVPAFRGRLVADGVLTGEEAAAIAEEVREELQAAVDFGLQSPFPEVETALEYTYA